MRIKNKKSKKFYLIIGGLIIFFGTFMFWVASLNDYDIKEVDLPAIKEKIKENIANVEEKISTTTLVVDTVEQDSESKILLSVPFSSQAPDGQWEDSRFQDGCEETAVLMAMKWVKGEVLTKAEAKATILDMADWELKSYGSFVDTNAQDTADRLIRNYFSYKKFRVSQELTAKSIIAELQAGNLLLIPTNGQKLYNPHYKAPGPEHHMLVVRGYDLATDEFITNDAGTKVGEGYRYKAEVLLGAAVDYATGNHEPILTKKQAMIIIYK